MGESQSSGIDTEPKVYLTESADTIDELSVLAEQAGVLATGAYYGGGYEGLPDSKIIRWKSFQDAHIEVTPTGPLRHCSYKTSHVDISKNRRVGKRKDNEVFDFKLYQVEAGRRGTKTVMAWCEPDAEGIYDIVEIPEGAATYRLLWVESASTKQRRQHQEYLNKEEERQALFERTLAEAIAKATSEE